MNEKTGFTKLLRIITATIEGLEQSELDQLITGKAKLTFVATEKERREGSSRNVDEAGIISALNACRDRDDARRILGAVAGRDSLASLARAMKVHVVKQDRREDIESKIIEFVIGGKLRTEAIQTLNLRGGSSDPGKE